MPISAESLVFHEVGVGRAISVMTSGRAAMLSDCRVPRLLTPSSARADAHPTRALRRRSPDAHRCSRALIIKPDLSSPRSLDQVARKNCISLALAAGLLLLGWGVLLQPASSELGCSMDVTQFAVLTMSRNDPQTFFLEQQ